MTRLDGARLARQIREELKPQAEAFARSRGRQAGLGVVLAGTRDESEIYVRHKLKAVNDAGCRAELFRLGADDSLDQALALVAVLNADDRIDGILVQSPLPPGMGKGAEQVIFDAIDPAKDVDGFHPINVGKLVQKRPSLVACTPLGCIEILERSGIPIAGRHAVVIGRSDIVGKPMSLLLLHRDATVTMCHSRTPDVAEISRRADIVVAAVGRPGFVTRAFVKPGAVVIDVGISRITDRADVERLYAPGSPRWTRFETKGSLVVGDVHPDVESVAGALTPVPGGVGPMTIAMVLRNTLRAAETRTQ